MFTPAIEIKGVHKAFGRQVVLDGLDLKVPAGSIFALLGPNGAGKTTLVNILSTLVTPDSGTVTVAGYDVVAQKQEVKQAVSLTGQFAAVDEVLTAEENLRMMCRLWGLTRTEAKQRTAELLQQFQLADAAKKRVKTFSGGMRRRLDLAISLIVRRPVLFLDEPTTGLDTRSRRDLWEVIKNLAAEGMTIFLTTQYLEEADELADVIAVINRGKVVAEGTAQALKSRIGGDVVELLDAHDEIIREAPTDGSIEHLMQTLDELKQEAPPDSRINIRRPSMDDVFLALTRTDEAHTEMEVYS